MNEKPTIGPPKGQVLRKENRKRITFLLKLLLLVGLIYAYLRFDEWIEMVALQDRALEDALARIIRALLFILTANLLISLGRIVLVALYIRRKTHRSRQNNAVLAINRIATLLNGAVIVVAGFLLFGLDWDVFFGTFSLVAVAMAILTKDYIANTVNGLINMTSDRLALGDHVKIGNHEGKVTDITLSNTYLENEEGYYISLPNNTVFAADIINYSQQRGELVEVPIEVRLDAVRDLSAWEANLRESLQPYQSHLIPASIKLLVRSVSVDKVQLTVQFRVKRVTADRKKEMVHAVLRRFITSTVTAE